MIFSKNVTGILNVCFDMLIFFVTKSGWPRAGECRNIRQKGLKKFCDYAFENSDVNVGDSSL